MDSDALAAKAVSRAAWARHAARGRGRGWAGRGRQETAPDLPSNAARYDGQGAGDAGADQPGAAPDAAPAATTSTGPAELRDLLARAGALDYASAHRERVDLEAAWLKTVAAYAAPPSTSTNPLALDAAALGRALAGLPVSELLGVEKGLVTDDEDEGVAAAAEAPGAAVPPPPAPEQALRGGGGPPPPPQPASSDLDADLDALLGGGSGPPPAPPPSRPPVGDWF
jgi:hypothetical protein